MIKINNKFDFKQMVYIVGDSDHVAGVITSMTVNPEGTIVYGVSRNGEVCDCYDFELSTEIDPKSL